MAQAVHHISRSQGPRFAVGLPESVQGGFGRGMVFPEVACYVGKPQRLDTVSARDCVANAFAADSILLVGERQRDMSHS